ncbi:hypothetical protein BDM02DRAFT_3122335 [Thelephora ganbajun]|uniref:Uncharacterized protein n=1 Tax=Thelephora ganbajun TaxID=370292 RepID=A0ACB6Z390_THEGA|nr:hypothetical protein BDM02DRAFT_3122335 [Thelephora ganbajun]
MSPSYASLSSHRANASHRFTQEPSLKTNDVIRQPGGSEHFFLTLPHDIPDCQGHLSMVCASKLQQKRVKMAILMYLDHI